MTDMSWMDHARTRCGENPRLFSEVRYPAQARAAQQVCDSCPGQVACLAWWRGQPSAHRADFVAGGVWWGSRGVQEYIPEPPPLPPPAPRVVRRKRQLRPTPAYPAVPSTVQVEGLKPCGTPAAYRRHLAAGERLDDACKLVGRRWETDRQRWKRQRARLRTQLDISA